MLAYGLYLNNKESTSRIGKRSKLLKKIYVNKGTLTVDPKTFDEYGNIRSYFQSNGSDFLQQWLSMPPNTTDVDKLNLPDKRTGSKSPSPYVKIHAKLKINK